MTKQEWYQRASALTEARQPLYVVPVNGTRVTVALKVHLNEKENWLTIEYQRYTNFYVNDFDLPDILVRITPEA